MPVYEAKSGPPPLCAGMKGDDKLGAKRRAKLDANLLVNVLGYAQVSQVQLASLWRVVEWEAANKCHLHLQSWRVWRRSIASTGALQASAQAVADLCQGWHLSWLHISWSSMAVTIKSTDPLGRSLPLVTTFPPVRRYSLTSASST